MVLYHKLELLIEDDGRSIVYRSNEAYGNNTEGKEFYIHRMDVATGRKSVVAEMEGRLGAPIYGMLSIEDFVKEYTTPDGNQMTTMPMNLFGPPKDDLKSNYEWTGEWTVTYETFRDMGLAFIAALLLSGVMVWAGLKITRQKLTEVIK